MLDLTLFISGTALLDSVSTTQQIVILILLFSAPRPGRTSLGFILGITTAYFVCGLVGLALVNQWNAAVKVPDATAYAIQAALGIVLVVSGPGYWYYLRKTKRPTAEDKLMALMQRMNFRTTFGLGAVLSTVSFPAAVPYLAALGKIAAAPLGWPTQAGLVALYNLIYALPLVVPFVLFLVLREGIVHRLHIHTRRLNTVVTVVLLSAMGLYLLADSCAFFWGGRNMST